jgi:hypothetical protein
MPHITPSNTTIKKKLKGKNETRKNPAACQCSKSIQKPKAWIEEEK